MPSQLILDRSDPGVNELVAKWSDGGKYTIEIDITQSSSSPNTASFEVTSVTDMSEPMEEEMEEPAPAPPAKPKRPVPGKPAMNVAKPSY